jgi:hypothetical protein
MKISIFYNWPLGEDSARVSLGMPSEEDIKYQFRLGVIEGTDSGGWINPGWVNHDQIDQLSTSIKKGWKIKLEKKDKETGKVEAIPGIDSLQEWPNDATGETSVDTGFWI